MTIKEMNASGQFLAWLLEMGYMTEEDIQYDGDEIEDDLHKTREVAPKLYNMLMCMCNCEERVK